MKIVHARKAAHEKGLDNEQRTEMPNTVDGPRNLRDRSDHWCSGRNLLVQRYGLGSCQRLLFLIFTISVAPLGSAGRGSDEQNNGTIRHSVNLAISPLDSSVGSSLDLSARGSREKQG
jgi:hypothetical protein